MIKPTPSVIISRPEELKRKLRQFTKDNVHIIADFDYTITSYKDKDGGRNSSVYAQIRKHKYLGEEYSKLAYALYDHYYPIETNPLLPEAGKNKAMIEWWEKHLQLIIKYGLTKKMLEHIAEHQEINLRSGADIFFKLLAQYNIPLLIFSAGLGDVIDHYLRIRVKISQGIHIISNFYVFDKDGKVMKYKDGIIHSLNKNEISVKNHPYYQEIREKKNVILIGDKLEDINMSQGVKHDTIIKIGFLNEKEDEFLQKFAESFDIVILHDGPFDEVNRIIEEIVQEKK